MNNSVKSLITKGKDVTAKGWIQSSGNGTGAVGITYENELGINSKGFEIPDDIDAGVEIKTKYSTKYPYITLFAAVPDSYLYEIKRLHAQYGYPDEKDKNIKVFNISLWTNKEVRLSNRYLCNLHINRQERKLIMVVKTKNGKIIDTNCSWSFDWLEEKLQRKLKYLMFVKAKRKYELKQEFFRYDTPKLYELRSFDDFITAIENGYIRITFKISTFRSGKKYGQAHDHGTSFDIKEEHLDEVYEEIKLEDLDQHIKE